MARRRFKRFTASSARPQGISRPTAIVLCVVAFLILSFGISVVVGLLLGREADSQNESDGGYGFEKYEYNGDGKTVRSVEAYHFVRNASAADYATQDIVDFSFAIRHSDGSLDYSLGIADSLGIDSVASDTSLEDRVDEIHRSGGYACGYFHVLSLSVEDARLREVMEEYELALIGEAAEMGVDDILLVGIDVTDGSITKVESFVARAATAAKGAALGVALDEDVFLASEDEIYLSGRVASVCDYVAIDLRYMEYGSAETFVGEDGESMSPLAYTVDKLKYYIKSYPARIIFSAENSKLYREAVSLGIVDFQIVGE